MTDRARPFALAVPETLERLLCSERRPAHGWSVNHASGARRAQAGRKPAVRELDFPETTAPWRFHHEHISRFHLDARDMT